MKKLRKTYRIKKENFLKQLFKQGKILIEEPRKPFIRDLLEKKLIYPEKNHWVLTEKGKQIAGEIIRKHRIYETFLAKKTGFHSKEWHKLAERKEHEIDNETLEKWEKELGYPLVDPHGDLIASIPDHLKLPAKSLNEFSGKQDLFLKIIHLEDEPEELYHQIIEKGLYPGLVMKARKENNKWHLNFEGLQIQISQKVAELINAVQVNPNLWKANLLRLSALQKGEKARIVGISEALHGLPRQRLLDLGFVKNTLVAVYLEAPLKEPVAYDVRGATVALRKDQADKILIEKL